MSKRAPKRVRVDDYEYNDEVAERAAKRIKKEPKIKQEIEIKQEAKIKPDPANNNIKKEPKIEIKSEVKSEIKVELKKEKQEKVKLEPKLEVKRENDAMDETSDQDDAENENSNDPDSEEQGEDDPDAIDISDDDEEDRESNEDEEAMRMGTDKGKYNFDDFKTIAVVVVPDGNKQLRLNTADQSQAFITTPIIERIISVSDVPQIMIWSRVSKSTSNLVHGDQSLWHKLFRGRHWHLPHEIRNKNFKPVPQLKSTNEDQVDWFREFKRNYITGENIKRVIGEICELLNKEGYKFEEDARMSDEIIKAWEQKHKYLLSNDLREYYKNCPLQGLQISPLEDVYECSPEVSLTSLYRLKIDEEHGDDDEGEPDLGSIAKVLELPKSKVDEDPIGGMITIREVGRQGDIVHVPYLSLTYFICPDDFGGVFFGRESTLLQLLEETREDLKRPKAQRTRFRLNYSR